MLPFDNLATFPFQHIYVYMYMYIDMVQGY